MLRLILEEKNMTLYALEKKSKIKHATLNDIYNERCKIENCSYITVKKIADALNMNIESLFDILSYKDMHYITYDKKFDLFKSNMCHELARIKDIEFLKKYLENDSVNEYYKRKEYTKALYMLSMIEYLLEKNNISLPESFNELRTIKTKYVLVPESIYLLLKARMKTYTEIVKETIPYFLEHNIVESDIYNVV